jgi:hypothetical protein
MATAEQPKTPTPQKQMVKAIVEGLMDKRLGEYLNAWIPQAHGTMKCEMALLTIQYDPNRTRPAQKAWQEVSQLEKTVVNILAMEEDILYVVSTVEMHSGRKRGKPKAKGKEETKTVKVNEETLSVKTKEDVNGVFKKYNEKLEYEPGEEYIPRVYKYLKSMEGEGEQMEMLREVARAEEVQGKEPTEVLYKMAIVSLNGRKVKSANEDEEVTLKGYPHIHMAIAFTTTTGVIRDLRTIAQKVLIYAHDVDIRKKDGTSMKTRRGRKVDIANDSKIIGYVMKNARHEGTANLLQRNPTILYNFRNNYNITQLYTGIYINTAVVLTMDANPREKIEISQPTITLEITSPKATSENTNLAPTVTNKPIAKTKLMQMVNLVKTYLEEKQMAITPRGTIYQRIRKSKRSWKLWGAPERLHEDMCNLETLELLNSTKSEFFTYTSGGYKNIFPYVELDFAWIEFKDFYMHLPTGGIVRENDKYECFAYFPEISYDDIQRIVTEGPEKWMKILRNSEYLNGVTPTPEGIELIKRIYEMMTPKTHKSKSLVLHGDPNSGKSSLIEPIIGIYPTDVVMVLTKAGGFELGGLETKQMVILDEFSKKDTGLSREKILKIAEGDATMAVNRKHKDIKTIKTNARAAIISNKLGWAEEENKDVWKGPPAEGEMIITTEVTIEDVDPAYKSRMEFYRMKAFPANAYSATERRQMVDTEKGKIVLYMAKTYFGEHAFRLFEKIEDMKIYVDDYKQEIEEEI